ncbi:cobalamin-binding protein [Nitrosospira briensis]|uniref:Iron complex transport system substrate-binding protein n=1 Tax=Nitrosospira briensis TaxID=35799 RepID=A0A1I5ECS8_9PROT|nr:cobalamin-binding protein [Nitrosospira briensis]SFO08881.1 iron complex transport system substrate-binding protein [Nitrosospira briensis]SFO27218.1 iron complex transport system substrate-binding protein [Nitrosospira briensis]
MPLNKIRRSVLILLFVFPASLLGTSIGIAGVINVAAAALPAFPIKLTDDRGHSVRLDHFAKRIVSLSPHITELIFAAGAGSKLVGVSRYSDYPDAARTVQDVGDASNLDLERIVALKPDLVVAWHSGNARKDIEKLEKLGITVFATEANKLGDVPRLLRTAGKLAGTSMQAESAASDYEEELQGIKHTYSDRRKISVFQVIWHQPLMTVNGNHLISDIIGICGGVNVFRSAPSLTPVISPENLVEADPQAIISSASDEFAETGARNLSRRFPQVSAVRNSHLFFVHPDLLHRQTVRMLRAAKTVCAQLDSVRSRQQKDVSGTGADAATRSSS